MNDYAEYFRQMLVRGTEQAVAWDRDVVQNQVPMITDSVGPDRRGVVVAQGESAVISCEVRVMDLLLLAYRIILWWPNWHHDSVACAHFSHRCPLHWTWWGPGTYLGRHDWEFLKREPVLTAQRQSTGYWELVL